MDDLIRRSATAKDLREYAERKAQVNGIEYANGILAAACRIEQAIPAVDAVEVVRCKDCKYSAVDGSYTSTEQMDTHLNCRMWLTANRHSTAIVRRDGYCAWGQRRE